MKKFFAILLSVSLIIGGTGIAAFAAPIPPAEVNVTETLLSGGITKLEFSILKATDLYGISLDMIYDQTKLDIVTASGTVVTTPVVSVPGFFGSGVTDVDLQNASETQSVSEAYTALNTASEDKISFVRLLAGDRSGVAITSKSIFGEIYFKVKQGQTFTGFGNLTLVSEPEDVTSSNKICLKLVDSSGVRIMSTLGQGPLMLKILLRPSELTLESSSLFTTNPVELIIMRGGAVHRSIPYTASGVAINSGSAFGMYGEVMSTPDLNVGDTYYVKMAGFKSSVGTITDPGSAGGTLDLNLDMLLGNMNSDNVINAQDVALFSQDFGKTTKLVSDFNRDGIVNIKDLYYMGKNIE